MSITTVAYNILVSVPDLPLCLGVLKHRVPLAIFLPNNL